jgi:hypothetical protein
MVSPFTINDAESLVNPTKNNLPIYFTLFQIVKVRHRETWSVPVYPLENIAFRAEIGCDTVVLSDFSKLLAIPLRDGCDLMDVIGRRLRALAAK